MVLNSLLISSIVSINLVLKYDFLPVIKDKSNGTLSSNSYFVVSQWWDKKINNDGKKLSIFINS